MNVVLSVFLAVVILGATFVIIFDNGDSGTKLAWLLIITLIPVVGLLLYFMCGLNYRNHWFFKRQHQRFLDEYNAGTDRSISHLLFGHAADKNIREEYRQLSLLMSRINLLSASEGNDVEIITEGKRKKELMIRDLLQAKRSIHMEYFLFGDDKGSRDIKNILMAKARQGVKVRFIHENIANIGINSRYYSDMTKAGVEVLKFTNPRRHLLNLITRLNYRNHRKIVVIDEEIGYTGGMNISDKYFLKWRDTHMRITGKAVAGLQFIFLDSWFTAGGTLDRPFGDYFPQKSGEPGSDPVDTDAAAGQNSQNASVPETDNNYKTLKNKTIQIVPDESDSIWPVIQMSIEWALQHTRKYIWIQTPYFVPPESTLNALKSAALSGVDVRIMLPAKADNWFMGPANKAFFTECLEAGIRIYERGGEFIHAKTLVCDDYLSVIGTANMDYRSFHLNYEVNTYIYDEETALVCKGIFEKDMEVSSEVRKDEWASRKWYKNLPQQILRLFSPLL